MSAPTAPAARCVLALTLVSCGACRQDPVPEDSDAGDAGAAPTSTGAATPTTTTGAPAPTSSGGPDAGLVAEISVDPAQGAAPLQVHFSAAGSHDAQGEALQYAWSFGDGGAASGVEVSHVYGAPGSHTATLTVTAADARTAVAEAMLAVDDGCPGFVAQPSPGSLTAPAILEASGLVASRQSPGVLWTHNDSDPDGPLLYAVAPDGRDLGRYALQGADVDDWEDMSIGPGPQAGRDYLHVGDIGDNSEKRESIVVYRAPEPPVDPRQSAIDASISGVEALRFTYPGGQAHDAETLLVDPRRGDLCVVTKRADGKSEVYCAVGPLAAGTHVLALAASLELGISAMATGGAVSPDGRLVAVRTYLDARVWRRPEGGALQDAFAGPSCPLPVVFEMQGEAIGFAADGLGYLTLSEGATPALHPYRRG